MKSNIYFLLLLSGIFSCTAKQQKQKSVPIAIMEELTAAGYEKSWPADSARANGANPDPVDLFRAAYLASMLGKTETADELIKKGLAVIPKKDQFYNELIILRAHQSAGKGNYAEAQYDFKTALSVDPANYTALNNQVYLASITGDHITAIKYAKNILNLYPADTIALNNLSYSCTESGYLQEAIKYGTEGLSVTKGRELRSSLLNNTGLAIGLSGDMEKGMGMIDESLQLRPENPYAWCNKGILLLEQGRKEPACAAFQTAKEKGGEKMTEIYIAENCQ